MTFRAEPIDGPYVYLTISKASNTKRWMITLHRKEEGTKVHNYSDDDGYPQHWNNFAITAYFREAEELRNNPGRANEPVWGWEYSYVSPYRVDSKRAEWMHRQLKAVDASMLAQTNTYGAAGTFVDYLTRVAVAVRAKGYFMLPESQRHHSAWHNQCDYTFLDPSAARWYVVKAGIDHVREILGDREEERS